MRVPAASIPSSECGPLPGAGVPGCMRALGTSTDATVARTAATASIANPWVYPDSFGKASAPTPEVTMLAMTAAPIDPPMVRMLRVHSARDAGLRDRNGGDDEARHGGEREAESSAEDGSREEDLPLVLVRDCEQEKGEDARGGPDDEDGPSTDPSCEAAGHHPQREHR